MAILSALFCAPMCTSSHFKHVEAPVGHVEENERDREDDPGVLVDDVDILDLGEGGADNPRPLLQLVQESCTPPLLPATLVLYSVHLQPCQQEDCQLMS